MKAFNIKPRNNLSFLFTSGGLVNVGARINCGNHGRGLIIPIIIVHYSVIPRKHSDAMVGICLVCVLSILLLPLVACSLASMVDYMIFTWSLNLNFQTYTHQFILPLPPTTIFIHCHSFSYSSGAHPLRFHQPLVQS